MKDKNSRRVTMQDIANAIGVTKATVSLAMKNDPRISADMREKIAAKAAEMNYRPSPLVNALMQEIRTQQVSDKSGATIGILIEGRKGDERLKLPSYAKIIEGIEDQAGRQGFRTEIFFTEDPDLPIDKLSKLISSRGIRALLFYEFIGELESDLPNIEWDNLAVMTFTRRHPQLEVNRVLMDYHHNTRLALDHLKSLGCKRIGLPQGYNLDPGLNYNISSAYMVWCHVHQNQQPLPYLPVKSVDLNEESFAKWVNEHKPDGIITHRSDLIDWLKNLGHKVPGDIAVALTNIGERPKSSGVDNRHKKIGEVAINVLAGQLLRNEFGAQEVPRLILVPGFWQAGDSTPS